MRDVYSARLLKPTRKPADAASFDKLGACVLPQLPTSFFGREDDLRALQALLTRVDVRLVTLSGAPGIGKTRLAIELSHEWQRSTGCDVCFVQLGAIRDPSLLLPTIALGFNVPQRRDTLLIERLAARLRSRPTLLVLDNFEHILDAGGVVIDLLVRSQNLKIIVTSRSALRVRGEHIWTVLPLRLPRLQESTTLASIESNASVALLLDRARSTQMEMTLTQENAAPIAAICVRLEGIPLAIELAAPWLRLYSPTVLLERLNNGLDLLGGGARDLPDRQRTLSNAIGWSDNLLEPHERRLFHRLAVFSDGWTVEAAERVCVESEGQVPHDLPQALSALLDKSLIYRVPVTSGSPRFSMLEMIREYALRKLGEQGDATIVRQRHAAYFQGLVREAAPHLYREEQALWLEMLEQEQGNLRATLRWLIDSSAALAALLLAADLENFWLVHDHLGEGQRWLEECLSKIESPRSESDAKARRTLATLLTRRGDYERAVQLHQNTLSFSLETHDDELRAQSLLDLGSLHFIAGDLVKASEHFDQALRLGERVKDQRTIARALNQLGELDRFQGNDAPALRHYEASLEIWRGLAERERIAMVLHNLAPVVARLGDRAGAITMFRESLAISWDLRNLHGLALCLVGIAGIAERNPVALAVAARLLGAADAFREAIGVHWQPVDRAEFERSVDSVRRALGGESFVNAYSDVTRLSSQHAFELGMALLRGEHLAPDEPVGRTRTPHVRGGLSRREFDVAHLIGRGYTNREIADHLHISEKTVEMHVSNAFKKLGLRSRLQLASWLDRLPQKSGAQADSLSLLSAVDGNTGENTGSSPIFLGTPPPLF